MNENVFLLHAFLLGIEITFLYDILRILRRFYTWQRHGVTGGYCLLDLLCGKSVFTDVPGEQWEPEMVRCVGGGIGNVSVSQDAKSPPGKICLRISQHALKPDS